MLISLLNAHNLKFDKPLTNQCDQPDIDITENRAKLNNIHLCTFVIKGDATEFFEPICVERVGLVEPVDVEVELLLL